MKKNFLFILFLLTAFCSYAQHGFFRGHNNYVAPANTSTPSNALDFDGVDDYVNCGTNPMLNLVSSMTFELWIKPNQNMGNGKWDRLIHRNWPTGYFFGGRNGSTNALAVVLSGDLNAAVTPNNSIDVGVWQHVGFVFDDPANTIKIYKNGTLISTSTWNGTITGNPNSLLTLSQSSETFNGAMDDVRIWNVARTQSEIQSNMNTELTGTETGLVAYYQFNQGITAGDNTSISTVTDKTTNALNGTLTNFAKTGTTSNFVVGKVNTNNNGSTTSPPSQVLTGGLVLNLDAANPESYSGTGTTWADLSGNGYNGTLINGPTFSSANGGSIVFNGINNVTTFGNILNIGLSSWTVSCWVKFNGGSAITGIIGKTSYRGYDGRYSIYIENNNLGAFFQSNNVFGTATPITPYLDNKFHNIVMTIDRTSMMYFYIDGILKGTPIDVSSTNGINLNTSTDNFYIGSYATNTGQTPDYFFNGNIGQASIYNRALTTAEVIANFNALRTRFGL